MPGILEAQDSTPEPGDGVELIDTHCQLRGTTTEALGALTSRNARRLFGFPETISKTC
ncbi:MAG: hypothetical protein HY599_04780 [Candidatus Omnitrophica bacterium]|nr:hypothetical protein [Candidatus Omnitrophota bacterium]